MLPCHHATFYTYIFLFRCSTLIKLVSEVDMSPDILLALAITMVQASRFTENLFFERIVQVLKNLVFIILKKPLIREPDHNRDHPMGYRI